MERGPSISALAAPLAPRRAGLVTDEQLVASVRAGDDAAFGTLYERYRRRIAAYIFGMVKDQGRAEDLTQEVFMAALRRIRETERPIAFKPWVYEIAKNACIDAFRRTRRTEEVSFDADDGLTSTDHGRLVALEPDPDDAVATKQRLETLQGAFGGLSDVHHQILVMRELEGLSYREIGERLGLSRPSVESTLFRARRRLSEEYEELVTGERCLRVQAIITASDGRAVGARDRRRLARHVVCCQPCRRQAHLAGVEIDLAAARRGAGSRVAALLPLPAFLKRRAGDGEAAMGGLLGGGHPSLHTWANVVTPFMDPAVASWTKAAAAAATVALAGLGAGAALHEAKVLDQGLPGASLVEKLRGDDDGASGGGAGRVAPPAGGPGGGGALGGGSPAAGNAGGGLAGGTSAGGGSNPGAASGGGRGGANAPAGGSGLVQGSNVAPAPSLPGPGSAPAGLRDVFGPNPAPAPNGERPELKHPTGTPDPAPVTDTVETTLGGAHRGVTATTGSVDSAATQVEQTTGAVQQAAGATGAVKAVAGSATSVAGAAGGALAAAVE